MYAIDPAATFVNPLPSPLNADAVIELELLIAPLAVISPATDNLSSIITLPPVESNVKLPADVSISLSPVTPTRIFPNVPPVAVTSPVDEIASLNSMAVPPVFD